MMQEATIVALTLFVAGIVGGIIRHYELKRRRRIDDQVEKNRKGINRNDEDINTLFGALYGDDDRPEDDGHMDKFSTTIDELQDSIDEIHDEMNEHHNEMYGELRNMGLRQMQVIEALDDLDDVSDFSKEDIPGLSDEDYPR